MKGEALWKEIIRFRFAKGSQWDYRGGRGLKSCFKMVTP